MFVTSHLRWSRLISRKPPRKRCIKY